MSRRDEAAEAAKGTSVSPDPYPTLPEMLRDWADTARKADTILKDVPMPQPRRDKAIARVRVDDYEPEVHTGERAGRTLDPMFSQHDQGLWNGYKNAENWLRARANRIEQGGQP